VAKTDLKTAHLGQLWKSPDGHEWIVSAVYDLNSSLLIDFNRLSANDSVIEKSVFSNATGWESLDDSVSLANHASS